MSEWKMVRLGDIFDLQMGKTPDRNRPEYFNTNTNKWVSIADISKAQKYILETKECISDEAVKNSGIKQIPANTIIMSFKLSIGKTAITTEPMYSNEAIMAFLPNGKYEVDNNFFYHLFSNKNWSEGSNKAVKGVTLNKATLTEVKIPLPPIDEQKHIAAMLDKCADIIAKRKQQLSALDDLIKARFVEMFGDVEYNTKSWPIQTLDLLCSIGSSKRIYQNEQTSEGIPFWRVSDLVSKMDNGFADSNLFISEKKYDELKQSGLVPVANDILVTSRGTLGRCYIIKEDDQFYFQDGMISWLSNYSEKITPLYLQYLFMMPDFRKQIDSMQAGSTVAYLSIAMLKKLKVMVPSKELQSDFSNFVSQVDKTKANIQKSLEKSQLLFDSLMQEYFG